MSISPKNILYNMGEGVPFPRKWLTDLKIAKHTIDNLVKSEHLYVLSKGVYLRRPVNTTWQSIVYSLQTIFQLDVTVGGLTALELLGYGHYLSSNEGIKPNLYADKKLPKWVTEKVDHGFIEHLNSDLLGPTTKKTDPSFQLNNYRVNFSWRDQQGPIFLSSPERAILEVLTDVPNNISLEHAYQLMQGMTSLSPEALQQLLENCHNIKVRRLFFWMADKLNYPWLKKLEQDHIEMGKGKRMIIKGGKLDKKYNITVPQNEFQ